MAKAKQAALVAARKERERQEEEDNQAEIARIEVMLKGPFGF